jgi:DNA repair protein RadD
MNRTLHSHQELAIWMLRQSLSSGSKRPVLQAPTGAGKTILAAAIIEMALAKAKRVLFCVPQLSLIDQTVERLGEEGIHQVGVIQSHHPGTDSSKPIQVCSLQTLKNRKLPEADLVIVDECHVMFDFYAKWMAKPEWQKIPFIGLTATPWTKALGKLYDDLLIPTTTAELIQKINPETGEPFLSKFKVYAPSHPDLRGVKTVAGDYHEGQLSAVMSEAKLTADIVKTWLEKGEDRPTLAFCVDLAHARKLRDQFEAAGVSCGYVDAFTTRLERNEIAEKFRARLYQVVCSVGTLTTGIDWDVRCIILARPTKSEILYVQIIGRGLRTGIGKTECLILDHSDTTLRLGFVTDIHHETLDDGESRKASVARVDNEEPKPRECPACHVLKAPKVHVCPHCGFAPAKQPSVETRDGELVEITRKGKADIGSKQEVYSGLLWIASARGYKEGWVANQYRQAFGVWPARLVDRPMVPSNQLQSWVTSQQIRYWKGRERSHAGAN